MTLTGSNFHHPAHKRMVNPDGLEWLLFPFISSTHNASFRRLVGRIALPVSKLRVDLRSDQGDQAGGIDPDHQNYEGPEYPIRPVVRSDAAHIQIEAEGEQEPSGHNQDRSRREPAPGPLAVGQGMVKPRDAQYGYHNRRSPAGHARQ